MYWINWGNKHFREKKGSCNNLPFHGYNLKNNHNSISYHADHWGSAPKELGVCFGIGKYNMAYLLTKNLVNKITSYSAVSLCSDCLNV